MEALLTVGITRLRIVHRRQLILRELVLILLVSSLKRLAISTIIDDARVYIPLHKP